MIDETIEVASVDQAFDAQTEWRAVLHCFAGEAEIAVSNVGDRGYDVEEAVDSLSSPTPPRSFPAKLLALLVTRFREGGRPLLFLPTELVAGNGRRLAQILSTLAIETRQSDAFRSWLAEHVVFADTLVDRIVSEAIEPVGAIAEPYALWAIRSGGFAEPFRHPALRLVDDLEPFERLKLHILNLGHSVLADQWLKRGLAPGETVREILANREVERLLMDIYEKEVLPGFGLQGMASEAPPYVATTLERFQNPFLNHRLADIAQNHQVKISIRIGGFLNWVRQRESRFAAPRLSEVLSS
ncbi:MAG TPA: mannitol dehydrogenase family protein [Roseiarcus sp.]|nr:mannitol dehydrogenase family protein [Roseiarcus sp.]